MSGLSRTPGKRVWVNSPPRVRIPPSPPNRDPSDASHLGFFLGGLIDCTGSATALTRRRSCTALVELSTQADADRLLCSPRFRHGVAPDNPEFIGATRQTRAGRVRTAKPRLGPWQRALSTRRRSRLATDTLVIRGSRRLQPVTQTIEAHSPTLRIRPWCSKQFIGRNCAGAARCTAGCHRPQAASSDIATRIRQRLGRATASRHSTFHAGASQFIPRKAQFVARRWLAWAGWQTLRRVPCRLQGGRSGCRRCRNAG